MKALVGTLLLIGFASPWSAMADQVGSGKGPRVLKERPLIGVITCVLQERFNQKNPNADQSVERSVEDSWAADPVSQRGYRNMKLLAAPLNRTFTNMNLDDTEKAYLIGQMLQETSFFNHMMETAYKNEKPIREAGNDAGSAIAELIYADTQDSSSYIKNKSSYKGEYKGRSPIHLTQCDHYIALLHNLNATKFAPKKEFLPKQAWNLNWPVKVNDLGAEHSEGLHESVSPSLKRAGHMQAYRYCSPKVWNRIAEEYQKDNGYPLDPCGIMNDPNASFNLSHELKCSDGQKNWSLSGAEVNALAIEAYVGNKRGLRSTLGEISKASASSKSVSRDGSRICNDPEFSSKDMKNICRNTEALTQHINSWDTAEGKKNRVRNTALALKCMKY